MSDDEEKYFQVPPDVHTLSGVSASRQQVAAFAFYAARKMVSGRSWGNGWSDRQLVSIKRKPSLASVSVSETRTGFAICQRQAVLNNAGTQVNAGQCVYKLTGLTFPDDKGRKLAGWAAESPPPLHSGYGETLKLAGFTFRDGRGCKLACWLLQNELYTGPADLLTAEVSLALSLDWRIIVAIYFRKLQLFIRWSFLHPCYPPLNMHFSITAFAVGLLCTTLSCEEDYLRLHAHPLTCNDPHGNGLRTE
ncbi:hypothetical protein BDZ88DRAFT_187675 [Geranomyces variabilis]|nr:hypothetical protein BDZ88DRAFT_187675 [Geranomyces variabilis]